MRNAFRKIVNNSDLIFARDDLSLKFAKEAADHSDKIQQAPDFTVKVKPDLQNDSDASNRVCVVPNQRMIEKASKPEDGKKYIILLKNLIRITEDAGLTPVILLHGDDDERLASTLQLTFPDILYHKEDDPIKLKKFIGESRLLIGSRFHAIISAMNQVVPAIGTSWSHKYEMLFSEFGCKELLLHIEDNEDELSELISESISGNTRERLRDRLQKNSQKIKHETDEMWKQVDHLIFEST